MKFIFQGNFQNDWFCYYKYVVFSVSLLYVSLWWLRGTYIYWSTTGIPAVLKALYFSILCCNKWYIAVNKQLADKERVAAALENSHLLEVVNQCLVSTRKSGWVKCALQGEHNVDQCCEEVQLTIWNICPRRKKHWFILATTCTLWIEWSGWMKHLHVVMLTFLRPKVYALLHYIDLVIWLRGIGKSLTLEAFILSKLYSGECIIQCWRLSCLVEEIMERMHLYI